MLQYLLGSHQTQEQKDIALNQQLPFSKNCHNHIVSMRKYLKEKELLHVAVPLQLSLHNKHKEATKVLLLGTNCNRETREIEWRKLALHELDPSIFQSIKWVERLQLAHNMLTSIPSNIIELHKLCQLNLQNNKLQRIPSGLLKMNCLRNLNLSKNKLTELPRKSHWSPSLKTLDVSDNLLEDLPKNIAGSKLKNLYIARNSLYEVPPHVCELITLETLDLSGNSRLTQLPVQMGKLTNISTLRLDNLDQVTDPPEHIKRSGTKTIMFLRAKLRNAKGYYSMKLMLVGRAAQGKTTLMHRLMNDYNYNLNSATNGISMEEFRIRKELFHKEYLFRVWDFGGQEDYYATHQCFLSTLSLYILVWNLEQGEEGVAKLEGWLDTISARAPGTCLIIVGTHVDKIRKDRSKYDENYLTRIHDSVEKLKSLDKYQSISVIGIKEVSCAIDSREGIDDLRTAIYDAAFSLLKRNGTNEVSVMGELIPHSYLLIEELMKGIKDDFKKRKQLPFMHRAEFEALVKDTIKRDASDVEDPNDVRDVTRFLHERGIVMHYDDPNQDLQDYYFIDPSWLCDLMARVVTLREVNPYGIDGILFKDTFEFIFKDERFPLEYYPQFVRLLNRFQIACSLDENRLLVPSKLPEEKPSEVTDLSLPFITIKRIHSLPFMPYGFWDRFMARLLYYTKDMLSSGCSNEKRPNSPGDTENDHLSPFLLDPFCCKCPLSSGSVTIDLSDSDAEPKCNQSCSRCFAEQSNQTANLSPNEESTQSEEVCYDEDVEIDDEEDEEEDEFSYAGVRRYVDEDEADAPDGLRINGQWFGQQRSSSDSDFGYSTDEDGEPVIGIGLKSGSYYPRVVRRREMTYSRNPRERKRKTRKNINMSFDFSPESFKSNSTKDGSTSNVCEASSISSSQSSSLNQKSPEISHSKTNYDHSVLPSQNSFWNGEPRGSSEGSGSSRASSYSNHETSSSSPSKDNLTIERNMSVESPKSVRDHSQSFDCNRKASNTSAVAQNENQQQMVKQETENHSVVVQKTQNSGYKNEHESETDSAFHQTSTTTTDDSCKMLPTIEEYLKVKSGNAPKHNEFVRKSVGDKSMHSSSIGECENKLRAHELNAYKHHDETHESKTERGDSLNNNVEPITNCSRLPTKDVPDIQEEQSGYEAKTNGSSPRSINTCSNGHLRWKPVIQEPIHEPNCRARQDFVFCNVPEIPTDLSSLIDGGFLFCWRTGICLNHERLFFSISTIKDPSEDRHLIVTEVTPSRVGRRVLNYVVDHIDTLINEWYQDLSSSDGIGPRVRQYIPCVLCERHNIQPHRFSFVECQLQSSQADNIPCPNHSGVDLSLHLVAPDVMLEDVDPELLLSKDEIQFDEGESSQIGSGGFGKVVRGKCRNQQVAIKFFIQNDETDPLKHYFEARKELNVLRRVRQHPYLISIIGVCLRPLCLVLELAEKGNLQDSLYSSMAIHRVVLYRIAYQVADALSYLHSLNVIYRDLKPENVLVWSLDERDDLHVKLIDFGTSNFATSIGLISVNGTPGTKAPEMLQISKKKQEYTMQVDVFSYAVLLFQIVVRRRPFLEFDAEPMINDAVVRGERPKWWKCPLSFYGLPSLTELMLQCWLSKPTLRPKSAQIAKQVRMPAFQALVGKIPVPSQQSVRHACVVQDMKEVWIACDDASSNTIFIFDCNNLDLKHTFSIEGDQDRKCSFQIQTLHHVAELMLIGVRGPINFISAYSTSPRYNKICSIVLDEQVTCVTSDDSYIYVGMNEGYVRCILKKDFKKPEKKRNDHLIKVERHCILSLIATKEKLWVSSSKYIFTYFTTTGDMDAFDMESMWYGGSRGVEDNSQTRITNLITSFDHQYVWSACRSVLTKWCASQRRIIFEIDCSTVIHAIDHRKNLNESDTCILCITPVLDTVWVGTAGGHILIFSADQAQLLTWFHPFAEVRSLSMCIGPGPCGTEQCLVFSTGKSLLVDGLGTRDPVVCPLTPERVRQVPDDLSTKVHAEQSRAKPRSKSNSGSRRKSSSTFYCEKDVVDSVKQLLFKCSMLVWEAVPANVLKRMEAKSGRAPVVVHYRRGSSYESSIDEE